jgi:hypothetical protein
LKGASWKNITVPNFYSEKQMELIENATNIEKRSFRMIWEFEGLDPDIEE